jgi:hypothetical protein
MTDFHKQLKNNNLNQVYCRAMVVCRPWQEAVGHIICDCSKTPKLNACRRDRQRNPKTGNQFGGYIWTGLAPGHRENAARPPPGVLNLIGEDGCLTLWPPIKKYRRPEIKN